MSSQFLNNIRVLFCIFSHNSLRQLTTFLQLVFHLIFWIIRNVFNLFLNFLLRWVELTLELALLQLLKTLNCLTTGIPFQSVLTVASVHGRSLANWVHIVWNSALDRLIMLLTGYIGQNLVIILLTLNLLLLSFLRPFISGNLFIMKSFHKRLFNHFLRLCIYLWSIFIRRLIFRIYLFLILLNFTFFVL